MMSIAGEAAKATVFDILTKFNEIALSKRKYGDIKLTSVTNNLGLQTDRIQKFCVEFLRNDNY